MIILRARFDGRVLIPEEPVELPRGCVLELQVREIRTDGAPPMPACFGERNGLPVVQVPPGSRIITTEDVRHAEDDG